MNSQINTDKHTIKKTDFTKVLLILFKETFEGMPANEGAVFLDRGVGVFSTLGVISARQASIETNQTTIAAHSEHIRFYLELLNNYLNENYRVVDFKRSWRVENVGEDEWDALRENMSKAYREVSETFEKSKEWSPDTMTAAMGIVAHTAYHLGAIRQMTKAI